MKQAGRIITTLQIEQYIAYLQEQERSHATLQKYAHILSKLCRELDGGIVTKAALVDWKQRLTCDHAPSSVNAMLTCVNGFVSFLGWKDCTVKLLKLQKNLFLDERRELKRAEYTRLVQAAESKGNERLSLLLQTICATGIRVSELQYITAESVFCGRVEISNKGKYRIVFLPEKLRRLLKKYLQKQKKTAGAVFTTRTGRPLDRSNIWREMKALCKTAGVSPEKVFPHNLRHLFARTFYAIEKDIAKLADILGHSSIDTTRIYIMTTGTEHRRKIERLGLIIWKIKKQT